ncbi:MAG TPA: Gldg family protein, partial [Myxococcota bacterium]
MAPIESSGKDGRALAGLPNLLAAIFVLAMFVSLRILEDQSRTAGLAIAWIAYAAMIVFRLRGRFAADDAGKRLLLLVGGPADTFLLAGGALCEWYVYGNKVPSGVLAGGLFCFAAGAAMMLALELAEGPMRALSFVDNRRAQAAARTALTIVCAIAACGALCFGVEKLDIRRDYSFAAPTSPSAATVSMLDAASCPAVAPSTTATKPELFLFYERGSTGLGVIRDYFDGLAKAGAKVTTIDSALDPVLAKSLKVAKNGVVGFRCGARTDTYSIGEEREDAEKKVNKLDEEVRTRLAKLSKDAATVYITIGHGERSSDDMASKPGDRFAVKNLKKLIEALNGKAKKLGVADGLTKEVPSDAALVIVPGPTAPFLPEEANALASYVKNGGALMLLLDPVVAGGVDVSASLAPLLTALNVKVGTHEILNDKAFVKSSNTDADHAFLYSTSFGSHKSVKTLSGARGKAALLFQQATDVQKRDAKVEQPKVTIIARTPPASFIDQNDDRKWDEKSEARAILDLATAVEFPAPADKDKPSSMKEGRAIVVGDSDVLADQLILQ